MANIEKMWGRLIVIWKEDDVTWNGIGFYDSFIWIVSWLPSLSDKKNQLERYRYMVGEDFIFRFQWWGPKSKAILEMEV